MRPQQSRFGGKCASRYPEMAAGCGKDYIFVKDRIEKGLLQNSCNIQHMEFEVRQSYIVYCLYSATALLVFLQDTPSRKEGDQAVTGI